MKKYIPILLAALLLLTSCGNIVNNPENTNEPSVVTAEETTAPDVTTAADIVTDEPSQPLSPVSPYVSRKSDEKSEADAIRSLRTVQANGLYRYTADVLPNYRLGLYPLTLFSGDNIIALNGLVNFTSDAMEAKGFTTFWVYDHYIADTSYGAFDLLTVHRGELKFACPIDIDDDGKYEILYYCEFGSTDEARNALRLVDMQDRTNRLLADDIFAMEFDLKYAQNGDIIDVSLYGKSVKEMLLMDITWHVNEDKDILALRGPSPWIIPATGMPITNDLRAEINNMCEVLKRDGYMTFPDGWKSSENITFYSTENFTPASFMDDENDKNFRIMVAYTGQKELVLFFHKGLGKFFKANVSSFYDIWMAKLVDINGDGNLDVVYYGSDSESEWSSYRLVVYDITNNKVQVIARSNFKMLPVTYDKDHVYIGGVDVVEYYKTLEIPTKEYYPPRTEPEPPVYTETTEAPLVDEITYSKFFIDKNGEIVNEDSKRFTLKLPTLGVEHNCTRYRFDAARRVQTKMVLTNIQADSYPNAENLILTFKFYILDEIDEKSPDKLFVTFKVIDENKPDPDSTDANLLLMPSIEIYPVKTGDIIDANITLPLNLFADGGSYICMYNG
ncbi:MAG: hypothetical protein K5647_08020 [Clostridiales bacterium]|nr:hypothetical protein [Clostridiales bacterium]